MSESSVFSQHLQAFVSSHPAIQGWKVYELSKRLWRKHSFHYLPDFLRDRHPTTVKDRTTVKKILEEELVETASYVHPADPGTDWDLRQELNADGWLGLVHVEWLDQPIHILSVTITTGFEPSNVYFVATKSNVALRQFTRELNIYGQSRRNAETRGILVVNGDDIPIAPVSWEEIFLPPGLAKAIRSNVTAFFQSADQYRTLGIPYRRGLLFTGPPGCGKTLTLKALASTMSVKVITLLGIEDVGDHEVNTALQLANTYAPSMVIFEDLDKLVRSKNISLSHFLNLLDGLTVLNGVMIIATANQPELLDPALVHRPSRFDRVWQFPLPGMEARLSLLRKLGAAYFSDAALKDAAHKSQGLSMTYVQEIVVNALLECAHKATKPTDAQLLQSLKELRSQRKCASKAAESLDEKDNLGFCLDNQVPIYQ